MSNSSSERIENWLDQEYWPLIRNEIMQPLASRDQSGRHLSHYALLINLSQRRYDPLVKPRMGLVPNSPWCSAPRSVPGYWYDDTRFRLGLLLLTLTICWLPSSKGPRTRWKHFINDVDGISSRDPGNIYYSNQVVLSKKAMLGVWMSSLFFL